jgi:hypothetical protein
MTQPLKLAIPECRLPETAVGPQLARYRTLAEHVIDIHRDIGEVRVQFDKTVPEGLLAQTLVVERECCTFVGLDYQPPTRSLTITVANVAHDPRLDALIALLTPPERT